MMVKPSRSGILSTRVLIFLSTVALVFANVVANQGILGAAVLLLVLCAVLIPEKEMFLYFVFFSSFRSIIKFPGIPFSIFIIIPIIHIVRKVFHHRCYIRVIDFLLMCLYFLFTFVVKLARGYSVTGDYISTILLMIYIQIYLNDRAGINSLEDSILYLSYGLFASYIASIFLKMGSLESVIRLNVLSVTRVSALMEDCNYLAYSAVFTMSVLLAVTISSERLSHKRSWIFIWVVAMAYLALLTVSKMAVISAVVILAFYMLMMLVSRNTINTKLGIIIAIIIIAVISIASGILNKFLNSYTARFQYIDVNNANDLTSGRMDTWMLYLSHLINDWTALMFGQGLSSVLVWSDIYAHNTFIQLIYQIGIIGTVMLVIWLKRLITSLAPLSLNPAMVIILIGFVLPIATLDVLLFDCTYIMFAFLALANAYFAKPYSGKLRRLVR